MPSGQTRQRGPVVGVPPPKATGQRDLVTKRTTRIAFSPLGQLQPLTRLLLQLAIAHLLEDVGIPRLVDLEGFAAVGADDFVHGEWGSYCWLGERLLTI